MFNLSIISQSIASVFSATADSYYNLVVACYLSFWRTARV